MKIGFDIDGVLAEFQESWVPRIIQATGENRYPATDYASRFPCWNHPQFHGYTDQQVLDSWKLIKTDPTFWHSLGALSWTNKVLSTLLQNQSNNGDDIYFITDRSGMHAKGQTERWLQDHGFYNPTVMLSSKKHLLADALKLDAYIDDKYENCYSVGLSVPTCQTFLLNMPWNERFGNGPFIRVASPTEMFGILLDQKLLV